MIKNKIRKIIKIKKTKIEARYLTTRYGRQSDYLGLKTKRSAVVYPAAHTFIGRYGVTLQGPSINSNNIYHLRWQGGISLGFNFSRKKARKLAFDFILHNKLPKGTRNSDY